MHSEKSNVDTVREEICSVWLEMLWKKYYLVQQYEHDYLVNHDYFPERTPSKKKFCL